MDALKIQLSKADSLLKNVRKPILKQFSQEVVCSLAAILCTETSINKLNAYIKLMKPIKNEEAPWDDDPWLAKWLESEEDLIREESGQKQRVIKAAEDRILRARQAYEAWLCSIQKTKSTVSAAPAAHDNHGSNTLASLAGCDRKAANTLYAMDIAARPATVEPPNRCENSSFHGRNSLGRLSSPLATAGTSILRRSQSCICGTTTPIVASFASNSVISRNIKGHQSVNNAESDSNGTTTRRRTFVCDLHALCTTPDQHDNLFPINSSSSKIESRGKTVNCDQNVETAYFVDGYSAVICPDSRAEFYDSPVTSTPNVRPPRPSKENSLISNRRLSKFFGQNTAHVFSRSSSVHLDDDVLKKTSVLCRSNRTFDLDMTNDNVDCKENFDPMKSTCHDQAEQTVIRVDGKLLDGDENYSGNLSRDAMDPRSVQTKMVTHVAFSSETAKLAKIPPRVGNATTVPLLLCQEVMPRLAQPRKDLKLRPARAVPGAITADAANAAVRYLPVAQRGRGFSSIRRPAAAVSYCSNKKQVLPSKASVAQPNARPPRPMQPRITSAINVSRPTTAIRPKLHSIRPGPTTCTIRFPLTKKL